MPAQVSQIPIRRIMRKNRILKLLAPAYAISICDFTMRFFRKIRRTGNLRNFCRHMRFPCAISNFDFSARSAESESAKLAVGPCDFVIFAAISKKSCVFTFHRCRGPPRFRAGRPCWPLYGCVCVRSPLWTSMRTLRSKLLLGKKQMHWSKWNQSVTFLKSKIRDNGPRHFSGCAYE